MWMLDVVGGLTELGAGSVWAVGVEEQSAVLDVVGGSTTKQVSSKALTQMIVPLGFTSVDEIIIVIYCTGHSSANTRCTRIELSKLKLSRL